MTQLGDPLSSTVIEKGELLVYVCDFVPPNPKYEISTSFESRLIKKMA